MEAELTKMLRIQTLETSLEVQIEPYCLLYKFVCSILGNLHCLAESNSPVPEPVGEGLIPWRDFYRKLGKQPLPLALGPLFCFIGEPGRGGSHVKL